MRGIASCSMSFWGSRGSISGSSSRQPRGSKTSSAGARPMLSVAEASCPHGGCNSLIRVAIALGSNLGDRAQYLHEALALLAPVIHDLHASTFHDTVPVGVGEQPRFLNAAAVGQTALGARALLDALLGLERQL